MTSDIRIEPEDMAPVTMTISPQSGDPYPSVDPRQLLVGKTPRTPITVNVKGPPLQPDRLALQLPAMRVNGQDTQIQKIEFVFVERGGVMACVQ